MSGAQLREAYRDNLKYVLTEVERLLSYINCPVVVTTDHRKFPGENGRYLHVHLYYRISREVPWFEVADEFVNQNQLDDHKPRHEVNTWQNQQTESSDEFRQRLRHLGYT